MAADARARVMADAYRDWLLMPRDSWTDDCLRFHGRLLTGRFRHWCGEWDDLPVDETCHEWPCGCVAMLGRGRR